MAKKKNTRRADGRIAVQVYIGRDECNRRKYKTVYGNTQKEADEKALSVKLALKKGLDVTSENDPFSRWADRWLAAKKTEVSLGQYKAYSCALEHLRPVLGDVPISKIKPIDIRDILNELAEINPNTGKPASKKLMLSIRSTASQIFRMAIDNRVIDYNPADAVSIPSAPEPTARRALTPEEQRWIEDTPHRAQIAAMIMMHAGLRRGELVALTWADIDLDAHTISVNKATEVVNGKFVVKPTPKTVNSIRIVDIPARLVEYLKAQPKTGMMVTTNARGGMHTESSFTRMWDSYMTELNLKYGDFSPFQRKKNNKQYKSKFDPEGVPFVIPHFTPHWLRHTFCTNMYLAGVDVLTAKEQMGHADVETTLGIYSHMDKQYKRREIKKVDEYLDASQMQVNKSEKVL